MAEEKKLDAATVATERKEPTYEELKNWCDQLMMQRNQVAQKLNQITDIINMLPWLFKVLEVRDSFDSEFVDFCKNTIKVILLPPEEKTEKEEENKETKE